MSNCARGGGDGFTFHFQEISRNMTASLRAPWHINFPQAALSLPKYPAILMQLVAGKSPSRFLRPPIPVVRRMLKEAWVVREWEGERQANNNFRSEFICFSLSSLPATRSWGLLPSKKLFALESSSKDWWREALRETTTLMMLGGFQFVFKLSGPVCIHLTSLSSFPSGGTDSDDTNLGAISTFDGESTDLRVVGKLRNFSHFTFGALNPCW